MLYQKELETAVRAVQLACDLCVEARTSLENRETATKDDRSPVTVADFGSQAVINMTVMQAFPEDVIVGEEEARLLREKPVIMERVMALVEKRMDRHAVGEVLAAIDAGAGDIDFKSRYWTVDPIDGTKGFLRGDQYAVALALVEEGTVRLGVLGCPALSPLSPGGDTGKNGVLLSAVLNAGAVVRSLSGGSPAPVRVDAGGDPANTRFCESVEKAHAAHEVHARICKTVGITAPPLRIDSQAKYAAVASALASVYLRLPRDRGYREKIWDHAAGSIIVTEAGGEVTDFSGGPLNFSTGRTLAGNAEGILATSGGEFHTEILKAIHRIRNSG